MPALLQHWMDIPLHPLCDDLCNTNIILTSNNKRQVLYKFLYSAILFHDSLPATDCSDCVSYAALHFHANFLNTSELYSPTMHRIIIIITAIITIIIKVIFYGFAPGFIVIIVREN